MGEELERAARRVDNAVERAELLEPGARRVALDLQAAVEGFHREGLTRLVRALREDPACRDALHRLVDDPAVYTLLVMHGIVRADPQTLVRQALARLEPQLGGAGQVQLVEVVPPVVRLRMPGGCTGCGAGAGGAREAVERAVLAVPGLERVEVISGRGGPVTIPLQEVRLRPDASDRGR
jgi:Fe-S cluster biogenesis protein NfuA